MTRDYKNLARRRSAPLTPGWVWLLIGLLIGLAVAFIVYLGGFTVSELKNSLPPAQAEKSPPTDVRSVTKPSQPVPAAPTTAKPRFDFYTILPEMEVAVPEHEVNGKPGKYLLQAGAFRSFEEADRLKASLVLLGMEASIQTVTVNNKDTWYRVHIGPYKSLAKVDAARARLKENRIETVVLKVKG